MAGVKDAIEGIPRAYAQLLFSDRRDVGVLLLAATLTQPAVGLMGLASVVLAFALWPALHLSAESVRTGAAGFNPALVGLALAATLPLTPRMMGLVALAVIGVVVLQASLEATLRYHLALPALSLPFVMATWAASLIGGAHSASSLPSVGVPLAFLRALGAILCLPTAAAGALVLAALVVHSRIAAVLAASGFVVAEAMAALAGVGDAVLHLTAEYNAALTAIALGGVWLVPQRSSWVTACVGAALAAGASLALAAVLGPHHLHALTLPFVGTVLVGLLALRQRTRDGAPKAVDSPRGSPEANLAAHQAQVDRFGARLGCRLSLPFAGPWTVTQGVDGQHTHRGLWKDALDFEVLDEHGRNHRGAGTALAEYGCYGLPVLAPAAGRVLRVVRDVPDNPIGEPNASDNWGNLVLIEHAPGLCSLVCHLAPRSTEVVEGQWVEARARLGRCGNSGRSFVPHLHFQLQSERRIGAPTVELELHDFLRLDGDNVLLAAGVPAEGESVRPLEREDARVSAGDFPLGRSWCFEVESDGATVEEVVTSRLDLFNRRVLESSRGGSLLLAVGSTGALFSELEGNGDGALGLLASACSRLPFDTARELRWTDRLARRPLRARWLSWLLDFAAPFFSRDGVELELTGQVCGDSWVVIGVGRVGRQALRTRARLTPGVGPVDLSRTLGGRTVRATLREVIDGDNDGSSGARPPGPDRAA